MPVIAVVNRKGGSGKSTFAAHVAAWCAGQGQSVMLGDVDRQQSSRAWLKRRGAVLPAIAPWAMDHKQMLRVPTGITHVVLDTPGGI
ncbi:MAG: ParA family protein, partial [Ramlibacter sp.]